jgi:glycosyltransferase involved in cell wall biosynthesis
VHDIHIQKEDHIPADQLQEKLARTYEATLRICYLGRADPMKGTQDWLDVLEAVAKAGVRFHAVWLGDGSELSAMQARIAAGPLADCVRLPGFLRDRRAIIEVLRKSHMMLFCHKTPESPRCLIEALTSGTPIVGYESAFPRELIEAHGGGQLSLRDDVAALARTVIHLAQDRCRLAGLVARASQDGSQFDDEKVFRHRSELIRTHLPRAR